MSIELRGVVARYGDREVLHGVDISVAPGERVAVVGPNGAGKSTVLRCMTGLLSARDGSVSWDGVPVSEIDRDRLARRIAVVPQQVALPFAIRVEDVVALGRVPHEHPLLGLQPQDRAAVASAIERVGIADLVGRDVRELSYGERQLVVLAMALAQDASLLVLDEPTVHLDIHHQVAVMELLSRVNEDGTSVFAVLHDLRLARHFFPRLIVLDNGRIVADGAPSEVLTDELIRRVFRVEPEFVGARGS